MVTFVVNVVAEPALPLVGSVLADRGHNAVRLLLAPCPADLRVRRPHLHGEKLDWAPVVSDALVAFLLS